jgi:hypothetical protein
MVGRAVTGIAVTNVDYASLPPHFSRDTLDQLLADDWNNIIPGYLHYPNCFKAVIPFLFASVVYHQDWLRIKLSSNHPIFLSRIFTQNYANLLKNDVHCGNYINETTNLQATGVPLELYTYHQVHRVQDLVKDLQVGVKRNADEVMEKFDTIVNDLPVKLKETILKNFEV